MAKGKGAKRIGAGTVGQGGLGRQTSNYSKEVHAANRMKKIEGRARKRQRSEEARQAAMQASKRVQKDGGGDGGDDDEGNGDGDDDAGADDDAEAPAKDDDERRKKVLRPNAFGVPLKADGGPIDETEFGAYKREMHAHDSEITKEVEKRKARLLRITKKIKLEEQVLREWDEEAEAENVAARRAKAMRKREEEANLKQLMSERAAKGLKPKPPKNRRSDPSTWKLRGGARPAHEVYDFDVRYVDPNLQRLEKERKAAARRVNVLYLASAHNAAVAKTAGGDSASTSDALLPTVTEHLAEKPNNLPLAANRLRLFLKLNVARAWSLHLLDQSRPPGYAASFRPMKSNKKKKGGDEDPVSASYQKLLKLSKDYDVRGEVSNWRWTALRILLSLDRNDVARSLLSKSFADFPSSPRSVWDLYSELLVEYVSAVVLQEGRKAALRKAVKSALDANVYAAIMLAYPEVFDGAVEYAEDLRDVGIEDGALLQAVEYAASEQGKEVWRGTDGATEFIKEELGRYFVEMEENGAGADFLNTLKKMAGKKGEVATGKVENGHDDDNGGDGSDDDDDDDESDDNNGESDSESEHESEDESDEDGDADEGASAGASSLVGSRIKKSDKRMYAGMVLTGVEMILENGGFEVSEDAMPWDADSDDDDDADMDEDEDAGMDDEEDEDEDEDEGDDEEEEMKGDKKGASDDDDDEDSDEDSDDQNFDDHDSD